MGGNPDTIDVFGLTDPVAAGAIIEAADEILDDDDTTEAGKQYLVDGLLFRADSYNNDSDVYILDPEHNERTELVGLDRLRSRAEAGQVSTFEAFVDDEFGVEVLDEVAYREGDIDVTTTQSRDVFSGITGNRLDVSDDVGITYVTYGKCGGQRDTDPEDRELRIGLRDQRDD